MHKAQRLIRLMMLVNEKKRFTVNELAKECGVSRRTMLRDLTELGELGVPLYSEVGAAGGYRVLREKLLPPISFTENEAFALFLLASRCSGIRRCRLKARPAARWINFTATFLPSSAAKSTVCASGYCSG